MNKLTSLATLLLTLALAACATAPTQPAAPEVPATSRPQPTVAVQPQATTAPQAATHSVFFARPAGNHGPAQAYDTLTGAQLFTLPDGLFSADGQYYFALQAAQGQTTLDSYSPVDGHLVQTTQLDGEWELSFVTANGHYVTLARQAPNKQQTEVLILEGRTGHERSRGSLEGNFEVDSLAPDGSALFLIEYLPSINPDHYQIRLFDVPAKALTPGALVDKRFPDEVMAGERWDSVSTPNGQWQLTLYLRIQKD